MTHPLTDELLYEMSLENWGMGFTDDNMRTAYDKGIQACIDWLHDYPWRGRTVQGIAEDMEEELLAHKGVLQSDQPNKED